LSDDLTSFIGDEQQCGKRNQYHGWNT